MSRETGAQIPQSESSGEVRDLRTERVGLPSESTAAVANVEHELGKVEEKNTEKIEPRLLDRVRGKLGALAKAVLLTGALYAVGTEKVELRSQIFGAEKLVKSRDVGGRTVYEHVDAETTHILNIVAGKEKLTSEEKISLQIDLARMSLSDTGRKLPENFAGLSEAERLDWLADDSAQWLIERDYGGENKNKLRDKFLYDNGPEERMILLEAWGVDVPEEVKKLDEAAFVNWMVEPYKEMVRKRYLLEERAAWKNIFSLLTSTPEFDEGTYEAIWRLEQEVGAPRVRLSYSAAASGMAFFAAESDGFYDGMSNTVYLNFGGIEARTLIAEMAHSQQRKEAPISTAFRELLALGRVISRTAKEMSVSSAKSAYGAEYSLPGSIEQEAHGPIEGKLRERFERYKKKQGDQP